MFGRDSISNLKPGVKHFSSQSTGEIVAKGLPEPLEYAIICPLFVTGRSAVRLARLHGVQEVPGSTPGAPTVQPFQLLV